MESDCYSHDFPSLPENQKPRNPADDPEGPWGTEDTPQGSGSRGKKSCSQAFVGPTKAEGISPVQISPPESMGVCLYVCVCPLPLPKHVHTLPYLWTCTFPKIH